MKITNCNNIIKDESGSVAIITAVVLFFVLIGIAALAIDIGRLATSKNELQNAADSAALAGAGELGRQYFFGEIYNETIIKNIAKDSGEENIASNINVSLNRDEDIEMGWWGSGFTPGLNNGINPSNNYNAVKVTITQNDIGTFFAKIFGFDSFNNIKAEATAALTGAERMNPGKVNAPFGLSELLVRDYCQDNNSVNYLVEFRPSNSCAKHHNFLWPSDTSSIRALAIQTIISHMPDEDNPGYVEGLVYGEEWFDGIDFKIKNLEKNADDLFGTQPMPEDFYVGNKFDFTHGRVSALFKSGSYLCVGDTSDLGIYSSSSRCYDSDSQTSYDEGPDPGNWGEVSQNNSAPASIEMLYDYFRYRDYDGDNEIWTTYAPIYKEDGSSMADCGSDSGLIEIVGFIEVEVKRVAPPPDSYYDVILNCDPDFTSGRGGGGQGPLMGFIPNLVE